jgi:hypothetical protein
MFRHDRVQRSRSEDFSLLLLIAAMGGGHDPTAARAERASIEEEVCRGR